jgi:hypothetical protein
MDQNATLHALLYMYCDAICKMLLAGAYGDAVV